MHFHCYIFYVLLAACLSALSSVQADEVTDSVVRTNGSVRDESETALNLLKNVTSIDSFMSLLQKEDGQNVTFSDVFSSFNNDTNKFVVAEDGGQVAVPDDCSPRMSTVKLTFNSTDPMVVYFPRCTKIERCGGGCTSRYLECVPSYTERINLRVFRAELPTTDTPKLTYKGFSSVVVERHIFCRVQCSLDAAKCGPKKVFLPAQCACKCPETLRCAPPKIWEPETCSCECAIKTECCSRGQWCGLVFNPETCRCGLPDGLHVGQSLANTNYSEDQNRLLSPSSVIEALPLQDEIQNQTSTTICTTTCTTVTNPTAATTTDTTPAPTTTSTMNTSPIISAVTSDPCATRNCPSNFVKVYNSDTNTCHCRLSALGRNRPQRAPAP